MARVGACSRNGRRNAAAMHEDREMAFDMMLEITHKSTQVKMARVHACSRNGRHNAAAMVEDREAPLVRPGQLEEMASINVPQGCPVRE